MDGAIKRKQQTQIRGKYTVQTGENMRVRQYNDEKDNMSPALPAAREGNERITCVVLTDVSILSKTFNAVTCLCTLQTRDRIAEEGMVRIE